jgi:hypothetical protein
MASSSSNGSINTKATQEGYTKCRMLKEKQMRIQGGLKIILISSTLLTTVPLLLLLLIVILLLVVICAISGNYYYRCW